MILTAPRSSAAEDTEQAPSLPSVTQDTFTLDLHRLDDSVPASRDWRSYRPWPLTDQIVASDRIVMVVRCTWASAPVLPSPARTADKWEQALTAWRRVLQNQLEHAGGEKVATSSAGAVAAPPQPQEHHGSQSPSRALLLRALDLISHPTEREEAPLSFDPDDYPLY